jgi:hypothetical protein
MQQRGSLVGIEPPSTPERTAQEFARALLGADAAASAYFSPTGLLLTADGTEVSGRVGITAVLGQIIESDHSLEIKLGRVLRLEDLALATQFWKRTSRPTGSNPSSTAPPRRC